MKTFFVLTLLLLGLYAVKVRQCQSGSDCPATQCCYIRDPNIASRRDLDTRAGPQFGISKDLTPENGQCGGFITNYCGCAPGLSCQFTSQNKREINLFRHFKTRDTAVCLPTTD